MIGDVVLFTGAKKVFASGVIAQKFHSPALARLLWGESDGQTWEHLYMLDEIREHSISYTELNAASGDAPGNNHQGFRVMSEEQSKRVLAKFDLFSDGHSPMSQADFSNFLEELDGDLDVAAESQRRVEQGYIRKALLPGPEAECALCGRIFPRAFIVAAHVKKRAACTHDERKDVPHVVMPACRLGCDELFERGYITVAESGDIVAQESLPATGPIEDYVLDHLAGRTIDNWLNGREKYFAWHREFWTQTVSLP